MKVNYQLHMVAGNLTDDVKSSEKWASFTVALDVGFGDNKTSHFFNMTAFPSTFSEKMWAMITNLKKGTNVMVEYEESDGSYEKDGVKIRAIKRVVSKVKPLFEAKKPETGTETGTETGSAPKSKPAQKASAPASVGSAKEDDDDIPF